MSRVGKKPITIPDKTKVNYTDRTLKVKGAKGELHRIIHPAVDLVIEDNELRVIALKQDRVTDAFQGMTRNLINNMVKGVSEGYERVLEINGIGYRAELKGDSLLFNLGYSHSIDFKIPNGVSASIDRNLVKLSGIDKELLGQTAAAIRRLRPPEPYKGKGIKFAEERIQRKAGKTGTK